MSVLKKAIDKKSFRWQKFHSKINLGSKSITSTDQIAEIYNKYLTELGPNLENKISTPLASLDIYLNNKWHLTVYKCLEY